MRTLQGIILFFIIISNINAQEQLGLRVENYAGINSTMLNPANSLSYPLAWDVNLVAFSQFADNNYAYFANAKLSDVINNSDNIRTPFDDGNPTSNNQLELDFNNKDINKFVSVFTQITGPSFSFKIGEENSVGLFTNVRAAFSVQRIPSELGYYQVYQTPTNQSIEVKKGMVVGMTWSEIGLTYARSIYTSDGYLGLGANIKILNGYEAGFARNNTTFMATQRAGDTLMINTPDIDFGYTSSNADIIDSGAFSLSRNGGGVAIDLGATYVYEGSEDMYKFKLGASILDFGLINFKKNTGQYRVQYDGSLEFAAEDYQAYNHPDAIVAALSQDIYNDTETIQTGNQFAVWLPTALSLQADYLILPMVYVSGTLVQRLPALGLAVQRGNYLGISPRFEHQWLAGALSLNLYNYRHFNMGAWLRLGYLTLGTENLGSLLSSNSNFTGTDFYIGLKINAFNANFGGGGGGFGRRNKKVKCYDF